MKTAPLKTISDNQRHVTLNIDLSGSRREVKPIWKFGNNTCHAPLWLRDDMMAHLELARTELNLGYIRCHGMLNDSMVTVDGNGRVNFDRVHDALDRLLERGLKPFFGVYAMPRIFCRNDAVVAHYRMPASPPKDFDDWYGLVKQLMASLLDRYGRSELREWYFEIWNEPDIDFWNGSMEEYFRLYDVAARAIKECDPELRVGGPATARTAWIREFCEHVSQPSLHFPLTVSRCDFIATHAYPSDLAYLDSAIGDVELLPSNVMRELFSEARRTIDATLGTHVPLICGEWNSSAGPLAVNHDSCNNGAFCVKTLLDLEQSCDGSLFWALSDIYEECGFHYEPFHGGYGLITVNGIRKAAWQAMRFLSELEGLAVPMKWSEPMPSVGGIATVDAGKITILLYYYIEPGHTDAPPINIDLTGFPLSARSATLHEIVPGAGSAFETWVDLGKPSFATAALLTQLEQASIPQVREVSVEQPLTLRPGTVVRVLVPHASA